MIPVVETLSSGGRVPLERSQFAVNLQAHPPGLKAFPELNGSFWDLPSGNLTSATFPQSEEVEPQNSELRLKTSDCTY